MCSFAIRALQDSLQGPGLKYHMQLCVQGGEIPGFAPSASTTHIAPILDGVYHVTCIAILSDTVSILCIYDIPLLIHTCIQYITTTVCINCITSQQSKHTCMDTDSSAYTRGFLVGSDKEWYHGEITRDEAEQALKASGCDCFLIRHCQGVLVLSLIHDGEFHHITVNYGPGWY